MESVGLRGGLVEYGDTGGEGAVVVFLHGLLMGGSLWDEVVGLMPGRVRCVVPTLPFGAHRHPVEGELSLEGLAAMVVELLDRLGIERVTLVGNDTGGAVAQVIVQRYPERVEKLVLVSCEAFDNFPPGLTGRTIVAAGRLPVGLFGAFMQQLRLRVVRRSPIAFGWLTKRGDAVVRGWLDPVLQDPAVRRDAVRLLRSLAKARPTVMAASENLARFDRPALVVWAADDKVMPLEHGRRLAELLPHGRLEVIEDSYTLLPLDQPGQLAKVIDAFV
jgi:pimeloyl-ACP methyl ester carboxylesterase